MDREIESQDFCYGGGLFRAAVLCHTDTFRHHTNQRPDSTGDLWCSGNGTAFSDFGFAFSLGCGWFDQFGIQRVAVDRGLLEREDKVEGVYVFFLEGDSI